MSRTAFLKGRGIWARLLALAKRAETDRGLLTLIWFLRFGALLGLGIYFVTNQISYSEYTLFQIRMALLIFFAYVVVSGAVGTFRFEWFLSQKVKLAQVVIEVGLYSFFYYLTQEPQSEVYFLYFLPLFVAVRYLSTPWALVTLGLASISLYIALHNMAASFSDHSIVQIYVYRELFVVGMTLLYALRRRHSVIADFQEEKSQLISAFKPFTDGLYVMDKEARLLFANDTLQARHGPYAPGQSCSSYFMCKEQLCAWCPSIKNWGDPYADMQKQEGTFIDRDGHPYRVEVSCCPLPDEGGQAIGAIVLVRDLSKQKEAERQLEEELQRIERRAQALTSERTKWLETYNEMGKRLAGFGDPEELMQFVVNEAKDRLSAETSALFLLENNRLVRKAIAGVESDWFPEESYEVGEGITGQAMVPDHDAKYGEPVLRNDVDENPLVIQLHLARYKERLNTHEVKHLIAVPLNGQEKSFGVLRVVNKLDGKGQLCAQGFRQEDMDFLVTIASMVAIAIENTRLLGEAMQRLQEISALYQASQVVTSSLDIEEVLSRIISLAGDVAGSDHTGVVLVGENGRLVTSVEDHQVGAPLYMRARPNGITRQVINTRQPMFFDELQDDGMTHNPVVVEQGFRSYGGVPITARDEVQGVLFVHSFKPNAFRGRGPLLSTFCNQAAIAIENARFYKKAERQAAMLGKLVEASRRLIEHTSLEELHQFCADTGATVFDVEDCSIYVRSEERQTVDLVASSGIPAHIWTKREALIDGPGLTAYVARTGETLNFGGDEFKEHPAWAGLHGEPFLEHLHYLPSKRCHSLLLGPLMDSKGKCVGVLKLENRHGECAGKCFSSFEVAMHKTFASHIGIAVERARLYQRLDEEARQRARESLSHDLHDTMNVLHGTLVLGTAYSKELMDRGDYAAAASKVDKMAKAAKHTYENLRRLRLDVRDPILQDKGLVPALRHYANMLPIAHVTFQTIGREKLPSDIEYAVYKIAQEALSNVARHAKLGESGDVQVRLRKSAQDFQLIVSDSGVGFDAKTTLDKEDAFGFQNMHRWAESIRARLEITSQPGGGTQVCIHGCLQEVLDERQD